MSSGTQPTSDTGPEPRQEEPITIPEEPLAAWLEQRVEDFEPATDDRHDGWWDALGPHS